ncbi:MAG: adenylate kinase [Ruminococcaceae bacterium]|nr:adenylate kinase [Oscillospiraceae bacterium]
MTAKVKLMFLGAPGCGKGTQSAFVAEKYGIPAISTGAIIRENIKAGTEIGKMAKDIISKGELLPDTVVLDMLLGRLEEKDCEKGYILDGFPRNIVQAEALEKAGIEIDAVVNIVADDALITERISGRRVCPKCEATYHVTDNAPKQDGICDGCGSELILRADDAPDVVLNRLRVYHEQTEPLIDFYDKKNKLINVTSQKEVEDTTKLIFDGLESFLKA